jgi:UDP-galactopyranose mutase
MSNVNYIYGPLEYRSLDFETETLEMENYQGNAVLINTDEKVPYTRIIETKHFDFADSPVTIITKGISQGMAKG